MPAETRTLTIARYRHARDNTPRTEEITWAELAAQLQRHGVRTRKDGWLWSPTSYAPDTTRGNENVREIHCLVLDVDDGAPPEQHASRWRHLEHVIHSTWSHTTDTPRWRVVFPLAVPVAGSDWPAVWAAAIAQLGLTVDTQCRDASRIYYLPAHPPQRPALARHNPGHWLDLSSIKAHRPAQKATRRARSDAQRAEAPPAPGDTRPPLKAFLTRALNEVGAEGRNRAGFNLACQLRDNGYSESETLEIAWPAYVPGHNLHGETEPYTDDEWGRTVRQVYSRPARDPWEPSVPIQLPARGNTPTSTNGANGKQSDVPHADESTPDPHTLSDLGNAYRLRDRWGHLLRYCSAWNSWLIYDGARWQRDRIRHVDTLASETIEALYHAAWRYEDPERQKAVSKWALACQNEQRLNAMVARARSVKELQSTPEQYDKTHWLLNCANGTVDLRTGRRRDHDPNDYLTQLTPIPYDPEAAYPRWLQFLHEIMDDQLELIEFLQRAVGYCLTGNVQERILFVLWGEGRNGKSTFLEILRDLLGDYGHKLAHSALMHAYNRGAGQATPDLVHLVGKRFAYVSETPEAGRLDEALVKELTGNERMTVRGLYEKEFSFDPQFKLWMGTNHKPAIRDTTDSIWDRVRLIPFNVRFSDGDLHHRIDRALPHKLREELPGILTWAVQGALEWSRHGLPEPAGVMEATTAYRSENDVIGAFLAECCVTGPGLKVRVRALYDRFRTWAERTGEFVPSQRKLSPQIAAKGFHQEHGTGGYMCWAGIDLLPDESPQWGGSSPE